MRREVSARTKNQPQLNIFQQVDEIANKKRRGFYALSYSWYKDTVAEVARRNDIYKTLVTLDETLIPSGGNLYLFEYSATWAKKLPYYDEFPLVYMLQGGRKFFGANLHYLNLPTRYKVLQSIQDGRPTIPKQCFHNYVYEGLDTPLFKINSEDWMKSIFLPLESFVSRQKGSYKRVNKSFVWGDSSR
jgi:hypothetical protein